MEVILQQGLNEKKDLTRRRSCKEGASCFQGQGDAPTMELWRWECDILRKPQVTEVGVWRAKGTVSKGRP